MSMSPFPRAGERGSLKAPPEAKKLRTFGLVSLQNQNRSQESRPAKYAYTVLGKNYTKIFLQNNKGIQNTKEKEISCGCEWHYLLGRVPLCRAPLHFDYIYFAPGSCF